MDTAPTTFMPAQDAPAVIHATSGSAFNCPQLSQQQWFALIACFEGWLDEQWRMVTLGNNKTKPAMVRTMVSMFYAGLRCNEMVRRLKIHSVTVARIWRLLRKFLSETPEFPVPKCACGGRLWHKSICPAWDSYHRPAIMKGHESQKRNAAIRHADGFFEAHGAAVAVVGQYQRQKHRDAIRREMMELVEQRPSMDFDSVVSNFRGRGFSRNSLSRILNFSTGKMLPVLAGRVFEITAPKRVNVEQANLFFETTQATANMKTASLITKIQDNAHQFAALVQQGIDAWTEAGRLLVEMIEEDPHAKNVIIEFCPDITEEILTRFEAIGRKQLHPKTLLNNSPGMRRLRQLPFSDQQRYLSEPVPVLVKTERGVDTLQVAVKNLTPAQALQVLTPDGVRSPEAQRAWIESHSARKHTATAPYRIKGNKVLFLADCEMTAHQLAQVLAQIS